MIAPSYLEYQRYVNDQVRNHHAERHDYHFVNDATMLMGYIGEIIVLSSGRINWRNGLRETLRARQTHPDVTVRYVET